MGRLENIIARNKPLPWYQHKMIRAAIILAMVILCFVLLAFTDLGHPRVEKKKPVDRVDGIYLRH